MATDETTVAAATAEIPPQADANILAPTRDAPIAADPFKSSLDREIPVSRPMADTYTSLQYHIFSTKNREPWIAREIEERVWAFIGGVARKNRMSALQVGGIEDHIHALIAATPTIAPAQIVQTLKGVSSKWIHDEFPSLKLFNWQDGYAAFTVSKSNIEAVVDYIKNQREHHRRKTFQEEYLEFLRANGVDYDERYVWG